KEVFGLDGPIGKQTELNAGACGPADTKIALTQAADVDMTAPIGKSQRAVEQDVVECETAASAHCPEPRIGELVVCKYVTRTGQLEVTLPARHKLSELPIISALEAARDAARPGTAVGKLARLKTEVPPHIRPAPKPIGRRRGRSAGRRPAGAGRAVEVARTCTGSRQRYRGYCPDQPLAHLPSAPSVCSWPAVPI